MTERIVHIHMHSSTFCGRPTDEVVSVSVAYDDTEKMEAYFKTSYGVAAKARWCKRCRETYSRTCFYPADEADDFYGSVPDMTADLSTIEYLRATRGGDAEHLTL